MSATSDLLEREGEVAQLGALLEAARAGAGRFVLVEGGAGIGKTRLLATARELGREAGMRVLHARATNIRPTFVPNPAAGAARLLGRPLAGSSNPRLNRQLALLCALSH